MHNKKLGVSHRDVTLGVSRPHQQKLLLLIHMHMQKEFSKTLLKRAKKHFFGEKQNGHLP